MHPADTEALLTALDGLKAAGNSLFVVEHDLDVIRKADWIVDVGPEAGEHGGRILYSGPPAGLAKIKESHTAHYLFGHAQIARQSLRAAQGQLRLEGLRHNNIHDLNVDIPLGVLTSVTGISGSGKSSLVGQLLVQIVARHLGHNVPPPSDEADELESVGHMIAGRITSGLDRVKRLVTVDQKPIGRTPRSNLATYTGLFDDVRKRFADTKAARSRNYDAGRFSFNVAKGRCETCQGEGFVFVELLFLPSVYARAPPVMVRVTTPRPWKSSCAENRLRMYSE